MILTEQGLHFRRDGDHWRCVEFPTLVMLRDGGYIVAGQRFDTLTEAEESLKSATLIGHRD
jgi:hypothetical protein